MLSISYLWNVVKRQRCHNISVDVATTMWQPFLQSAPSHSAVTAGPVEMKPFWNRTSNCHFCHGMNQWNQQKSDSPKKDCKTVPISLDSAFYRPYTQHDKSLSWGYRKFGLVSIWGTSGYIILRQNVRGNKASIVTLITNTTWIWWVLLTYSRPIYWKLSGSSCPSPRSIEQAPRRVGCIYQGRRPAESPGHTGSDGIVWQDHRNIDSNSWFLKHRIVIVIDPDVYIFVINAAFGKNLERCRLLLEECVCGRCWPNGEAFISW
jgi:hypothetical protein